MAKAFLIAAPWSNSGKTTVTLGLLRYFNKSGKKVQGFKCGPDYIDTKHHGTAAGRPSVNLDTVMMSNTHLKQVFSKYSSDTDINIVEGVMGLFDGAVKDKGSTADIAKTLDIPVILVVNAKAMAYSVAPILHGLKTFDSEVKIAGVIFNFVKTESHYTFLKEACETVGLSTLGYLPPHDDIAMPSRHLGLHIEDTFDTVIETAATHVEKHIDIPELWQCTKTQLFDLKDEVGGITVLNNRKIAVAKDEVFSFTYIENIEYLKRLGTVTFFSPIHDIVLPDVDFIYLAGGYPELHLEALSANTSMLKAIKVAADSGTQILAECGGMMYLGKGIIDENNITYPMANVFDFSTSMVNKGLKLGYRNLKFDNEDLWGHEFHYSKIIEDDTIPAKGEVYTARAKQTDTKLYHYNNVLASYIHLYWGEGNFKWLNNQTEANESCI